MSARIVADHLKRAFVGVVRQHGTRLRFSAIMVFPGRGDDIELRFTDDRPVGPVSTNPTAEAADTDIRLYCHRVRFPSGLLRHVDPHQLESLAHEVWSRVVEDTLVRGEEEAARLRIAELAQSGAHGDVLMEAMYAYQNIREHRRRHHETATEVRSRSAQAEALVRLMQQRMDGELQRLLYEDAPTTNQNPASTAPFTVADIQRAVDAVRGNANDRRSDELAAFQYLAGMRHRGRGGEPWSKEAKARGEKLLREHLTPKQRAEFEKHDYFHVIGCSTRKTYRITRGRQMNVYELDAAGKKVCGWCFLPGGNLCEGDTMLGQKIALECEEPAALAIANKFGVGGRGVSDRDMVEAIRYGLGASIRGRHADMLVIDDLV